jgi:hypothetical protein
MRTYICVRTPLYMCPNTAIYVSSYCCICDLTPLYMCPQTALSVSSYYCMCPHTTIYVSTYCYICVRILLYMCPHTTLCVLILLYMCRSRVREVLSSARRKHVFFFHFFLGRRPWKTSSARLLRQYWYFCTIKASELRALNRLIWASLFLRRDTSKALSLLALLVQKYKYWASLF